MVIDAADLATTGGISALVSFCLTPLAARTARRLGVVDIPGGYKTHTLATPLLGGLAVAAGAGAGLLWFILSLPPASEVADLPGLVALGFGAMVILAAGLLDDVCGLAPRHKFAWQLAAAVGAGLCLGLLGVQLQLSLALPSPLIMGLTVLWVVTITNSLNFLDSMDGLCAGLGAVGAWALALVNLQAGEHGVAVAAAALGGSCLGFLPYNWPRARIFLGDSGSMFIGFSLSAMSVIGLYTRGAEMPVLTVFAPLLVLAIPVLDLVLVVILRLRAGQPLWIGDRRHISHRLVKRGMSPAAVVATLWLASAVCGLAAILLPVAGPTETSLLFVLLGCAVGVLAVAAGSRGLP